MKDKVERLTEELEKYQSRLDQMKKDWSASKGGSRYGDEYLETQIKVYQDMISAVKKELLALGRKR
jgi:hypothetical protein